MSRLKKEAQIAAARDAYNALTSDQKRLVESLAVLTAAEAQLSVLKNDFLFEDGATGITLRADSGVLPLDTIMTVQEIVSGDVFDAILAKDYKASIFMILALPPMVPLWRPRRRLRSASRSLLRTPLFTALQPTAR